jgi:hypothetical protein
LITAKGNLAGGECQKVKHCVALRTACSTTGMNKVWKSLLSTLFLKDCHSFQDLPLIWGPKFRKIQHLPY